MPTTDLVTLDEAPFDAEPGAIAIAPAPREPGVDDPLTVLDGRVSVVDARLTDLMELVGAAGDQLRSAQDRVQALETAQSSTADVGTATQERLDSTTARVHSAADQLAAVTDRLDTVDLTLALLDGRIADLQGTLSEHGQALNEVTRTIAAEVERHTTDALVESRHSVQLAVNSIAQLSLAMAESSRDLTEDVSAESATALLDSFRVDLDAILGQLGFVALETAVGTTFDPRRHRALKRVLTSDPANDKLITRVIRDGYLSAATGRILLFADVEVSRRQS